MSSSAEDLVVGVKEADELARKFRAIDGAAGAGDPFEGEIPYSLLSAEHIKAYVEKTGLIAPFFVGGDKKSRLKKASYEGRIGNKAYLFTNDANPKQLLIGNTSNLIVPANSIVFVECDLEFRLPEFIAARFNLQIRHVHRGLLLGTGPLVDPGYWGKLCIPLHNLTDEPYEIPREEGLIWIEFTKTTSKLLADEKPAGTAPLKAKEYWDISEFLGKAASQFDASKPRIPIRSSLPEILEDARARSSLAAEKAELASTDASKARTEAQSAAGKVSTIGLGAFFAGAVGLIALWIPFHNTVRDYRSQFVPLSERVGHVVLDQQRLEEAAQRQIEQLNLELLALRDGLVASAEQNRLLAERIAELELLLVE